MKKIPITHLNKLIFFVIKIVSNAFSITLPLRKDLITVKIDKNML